MHATLREVHALHRIHVGDHCVQRECFIGRQSRVHRLETEDALQPLVGEERTDLLVEFGKCTHAQQGKTLSPRLHQIEWRIEIDVDERSHLRAIQLLQPYAEVEERRGLTSVGESPDLFGHRLTSVQHLELRAIGIDGPIHRIHLFQGDVVAHLTTNGVERSLE